jgi:hypothetical protein
LAHVTGVEVLALQVEPSDGDTLALEGDAKRTADETARTGDQDSVAHESLMRRKTPQMPCAGQQQGTCGG